MTLEDGLTGSATGVVYAWDILRFANEQLGFEADATQALVMNGRIQRGLLNCTRQSGKSTVMLADFPVVIRELGPTEVRSMPAPSPAVPRRGSLVF